MGMKPADMAARIARGLLSFPVTHFDAEDRFDAAAYRKHVLVAAGERGGGSVRRGRNR